MIFSGVFICKTSLEHLEMMAIHDSPLSSFPGLTQNEANGGGLTQCHKFVKELASLVKTLGNLVDPPKCPL